MFGTMVFHLIKSYYTQKCIFKVKKKAFSENLGGTGLLVEGWAFWLIYVSSLTTPPESGTTLMLRFIPTRRHLISRKFFM